MHFRPLTSALVAAVALLPSAAHAADPILVTDLLRIRTVSSIDVARDGSIAVFAVRSIAPAAPPLPQYVNQSHLYLLDLTDPDALPRRLTHGLPFDCQPVLSPDGRRIAFLRAAAPRNHHPPQLWNMPVDGGEARPLTDMPRGAASPQWSPDGLNVIFASSVPLRELAGSPPWPGERPGYDAADLPPDQPLSPRPDGNREEIRAWLDRNAARGNPNLLTRLNFKTDRDLTGPPTVRHLFAVNPDHPDAAPRRITGGFYDHLDAACMPDATGIVYVSKIRNAQHPDRVAQTEIRRVNLDGSDDRPLLRLDAWSLSNPRLSRDGSVLAFIGQLADEPDYRQRRLGIASISNGAASEPLWLTDALTFDASVRSFLWKPAGFSLLFTAPLRGGYPLLEIGEGLLEPAVVIDRHDNLPLGVHAFAAGGGALVYAASAPDNPSVLRVRDRRRGDRLVYDLNPWLAHKELSTPLEGWIERPDGRRVQYWLMPPTDRDPAESYPLVLEIHGGPQSMWGPGHLSSWHELQLLCSWGYAVVYANPRGSAGYGYDFQKASFQNWAQGPANDLLAVVDHVINEPWIDADRLVVTGGSYGGYLTAWIIANYSHFKAAVAQRGVYDLTAFFGEASAWRSVPDCMGGFPWEPRIRRILERESPFSFVNRIRTPLLIIHADNDQRVGIAQSEMLFRALKQLQRPVEYLRYPDADHDLSRTGDPLQRIDRLNRIIEFFERCIDNPRPAPQPPASPP